jgi:predicted phosphodiesterase
MKPLAYKEKAGITLIPVSCIHYPVGEEELLSKLVKRVKNDKSARVILMGDALDQDRTTRRKHRKSYVADQNSVYSHDDRHNRADVVALAGILEPIRDKVYGVLQGNHYYEYATGVTSDQYLCELLDVPYCGPVGVFRVTFDMNGSTKHMTIWSHHSGGSPGGRTIGGSVNALLRQESSWDADVYLLGHDHRRIAWRESTLSLSDAGEPKVIEHTRVFARVGAFLKTYQHEHCIPKKAPHFPGYGEYAAYRPADLGWVEIGISLKKKDDNVRRFAFDLRTPECQ